MHRAGLFGMERVGNVVLQHFPCAPAGDVKKPIVYGEINIGDERRHRFEALKQRRELLGIGWLSRDLDHFLNLPGSVLPMPEPNRGAQILERDDDTRKSICLGGVVRGAQFENHLVLLAKLERLDMTPLAQIPNMHLMTVSALQEFFGHNAVLDLVGRAPFAGQQGVLSDMPPKVITQILRAAVHLPFSQNLKGEVIYKENASRSIPVRSAQRADINPLRSAMDRMG